MVESGQIAQLMGSTRGMASLRDQTGDAAGTWEREQGPWEVTPEDGPSWRWASCQALQDKTAGFVQAEKGQEH